MNEDLTRLDLIGLLGRLEPVPEPPVVSLWPQTEAWLWLWLVVLAIAIGCIRLALLRRSANRYRRTALREIAAVGESPAALTEILRRTALAGFPRADVAGLHGEDWLAFLDRTGGLGSSSGRGREAKGGGTDFRQGPGRAFARAPYTQQIEGAAQLSRLAARWVRRHQVDVERER